MKIKELTLPSRDVDLQELFYRSTLGFACERKNTNELMVSCGDTMLKFVASDKQFYFHYCFLVPTGSIESAIEFLDGRSVLPLPYQGERIVHFDEGRAVYFYDADGNIAEFIERPTLGFEANSRFEPSSVLCLNEIGLPAENPKAFADDLINRYGIRVVPGGVYREDFVWCGDYQGAFVIPKIGRNWLPLDKPSERNDFDVTFETVSGQFNLTIES